jgi:uncharacterized membrane protein (UPF0127 family)
MTTMTRLTTMRYVSVVNQTTGQTLATRAAVADSIWSRFVGLQFRPSLPPGAGLVLLPCESIHMFFMRFAIDAVFAAQDGRVVRVGHRLRPWTVGPFARHALYCVELPAGAADGTQEGHVLQLVRGT